MSNIDVCSKRKERRTGECPGTTLEPRTRRKIF
jgi:hypothetical protein